MPLSIEHLLRSAREISGINITDTDAEAPLHILVTSLNGEARLSARGEAQMANRLIRLLVNRLRMERDIQAHPDIENEKIIAPIFIFGLPRTGTTKLQKLLSITGDFMALPLWMVHNPSLVSGDRAEDRQSRIEDSQSYVDWINSTCPDIRRIHQFDPLEPEEINPILEQGLRSAYLPAFVDVPSYMAWYAGEAAEKQLNYLHRVLQYLQWQFYPGAAKPWVLKNPTFLGMEPAIKNIFPDSALIVTHRDPVDVISSSASLVTNFHKLYSDQDASPSAGLMMLEGQFWLMNEHLQNRIDTARLDIIDIGYPELTGPAIAVAEKIYKRMARPLGATARTNIAAWEMAATHAPGSHKYALAQYRLSPSQISDRFRHYTELYGKHF